MRTPSLAFFVLLALLWPVTAAAAEPPAVQIEGVVKDRETKEPIENAFVLVHCTCLSSVLEAVTDERGYFRFDGPLPSGNYSVQVLSGHASVTKTFRWWRHDGKMRANFLVDRDDPEPHDILVESTRSFEAVVEISRRVRVGRGDRCVLLVTGECRCEPATYTAFYLSRSLIDDADMRWITGGPRVTRSLF